MQQVDNVNVAEHQVLVTPAQLKRELPLSAAVQSGVSEARRVVADIVNKALPTAYSAAPFQHEYGMGNI